MILLVVWAIYSTYSVKFFPAEAISAGNFLACEPFFRQMFEKVQKQTGNAKSALAKDDKSRYNILVLLRAGALSVSAPRNCQILSGKVVA